jgi:alkylhydroperoxidase/carboxymuconolactone decarboxylase family protein YurZ
VPYHTEQLRLRGLSDEQIQEAIRAANIVVEFSAYLHKINYSLEKFMKELKAALEHARRQSG